MNHAVAEHSELNRSAADCLVAFGSNEGNSAAIYRDVRERLVEIACGEVLASEPVATAAVGGPKQSDFFNGAFRFSTELSPTALHQVLIGIETEFGRQRRQRWGARRIDLDLLLYDEQVYSDARLQVPHPRMSFRRFVLEPANEIAGDMVHPISGLTIGELLSRINRPKNEILWITAQFRLAADLIEDLKAEFLDWDFSLLDRQDPAQSDFGGEPPKLIVSDFASPNPHRKAASLDLTGCSPAEIEIEIQAALKAMEPAPRA